MKTLQSKVEDMLAQYPICRDSDRILISAIYSTYYGVDVKHESFTDVMMRDNLPSFDSIGRARRKAQEEYPELRGSAESQERRKENEKRVLAYVRDRKERKHG